MLRQCYIGLSPIETGRFPRDPADWLASRISARWWGDGRVREPKLMDEDMGGGQNGYAIVWHVQSSRPFA